MASLRKLGVLVAIPIKGRRLLNRSGGKQSPYVQLKLGANEKKRTKASLIASVEPEWDQEAYVFQGVLDIHVSVFDEGKKHELIGEGTLLLHEVIDKGELDVWFPIKYKNAPAGEIYFELTFYALAPPPNVGPGRSPAPQMHLQHPPLRYAQPGYMPAGRPLPHTTMVGHPVGPPAPFPGNTYQHPTGYPNSNIPSQPRPQPPQPQPQPQPQPRPYPIPQQHPFIPTHSPATPPTQLGMNSTFRPKTQYNSRPQQAPVPAQIRPFPNIPNGNGPYNNMPPAQYPISPLSPQHPPGGVHMPLPRPTGPTTPVNNNHGRSAGPNPAYGRRPPPMTQVSSGSPVTPLVQYNYTLGSFP
ncbi:hypothetical protein BX616_000528 [Lobosporangium transversale]|nr:hypothetical protein BX616_000528 [Lobosporangium transversale]